MNSTQKRGATRESNENKRRNYPTNRRISTGSRDELGGFSHPGLKRTMSDLSSEKNQSMRSWLRAKNEAKKRKTNSVYKSNTSSKPKNNERLKRSESFHASTKPRMINKNDQIEDLSKKDSNQFQNQKHPKPPHSNNEKKAFDPFAIRPPSRIGTRSQPLPSPIPCKSPQQNPNSIPQKQIDNEETNELNTTHVENKNSKSILHTTLEQMKKDMEHKNVPDLPPLPSSDGSGDLNFVLESVEQELTGILREQQELHDTLNSHPFSPESRPVEGFFSENDMDREQIYKSNLLDQIESVHNNFNTNDDREEKEEEGDKIEGSDEGLTTEEDESDGSEIQYLQFEHEYFNTDEEGANNTKKVISESLKKAKEYSKELNSLINDKDSESRSNSSRIKSPSNRENSSAVNEQYEEIRRKLELREGELDHKERIIISLHREMETLQHSRFDEIQTLKEQILDLKTHLREEVSNRTVQIEDHYKDRIELLQDKVEHWKNSKKRSDEQSEISSKLVRNMEKALSSMRKILDEKESTISKMKLDSTGTTNYKLKLESEHGNSLENENAKLRQEVEQLKSSEKNLQELLNSMEKQWSMLSFEVEEASGEELTKDEMISKLKFFLADRDSYNGVLDHNLSDGEDNLALSDDQRTNEGSGKDFSEEEVQQRVMNATVDMDNRFEKILSYIMQCLEEVNIYSSIEEENESEEEFDSSTGLISEGLIKQIKRRVERFVDIFNTILDEQDEDGDQDSLALSKALGQKQKEYSSLKDQFHQEQRENEKLHDTINQYEKKINNMESNTYAKDEEIHKVESTVDTLVNKLNKKTQENENRTKEIEELKYEINSLKQKLEEVNQKHGNDITEKSSEYQTLENEYEQVKEEASEWKERAEEVEESLHETQQYLEHKNQEIEDVKDTSEEKIKSLEQNLQTSQKNLEEAKTTVINQAKQIEQMEIGSKEKDEKIQWYEEIESKQEQSLREREELTNELIEAKQELQDKQKELDKFSDVENLYQNATETIKNKETKISELEDQLDQETITVKELGSQLQKTENESESQKQEMQEELNELRGEVEKWHDQFDYAKLQIQRVADFSEEYINAYESKVSNSLNAQFYTLNNLTSQVQDLQKDLIRFKEENEKYRNEIKELDNTIKSLRTENEQNAKSMAKEKEYTDKLNEYEASMKDLFQRVEEKDRQLSSLQNEKDNVEERLEYALNDSESQNEEKENLKNEKMNLESQLEELKEKRENETATLSEELERLNLQIVELSEENKNHPQDIQKLRDQLSEAESRIQIKPEEGTKGVQTIEDQNSAKVSALNHQIDLMQQELDYYRRNSVDSSYLDQVQQHSGQYIKQIEDELRVKNNILQQLQSAGLASIENSQFSFSEEENADSNVPRKYNNDWKSNFKTELKIHNNNDFSWIQEDDSFDDNNENSESKSENDMENIHTNSSLNQENQSSEFNYIKERKETTGSPKNNSFGSREHGEWDYNELDLFDQFIDSEDEDIKSDNGDKSSHDLEKDEAVSYEQYQNETPDVNSSNVDQEVVTPRARVLSITDNESHDDKQQ